MESVGHSSRSVPCGIGRGSVQAAVVVGGVRSAVGAGRKAGPYLIYTGIVRVDLSQVSTSAKMEPWEIGMSKTKFAW